MQFANSHDMDLAKLQWIDQQAETFSENQCANRSIATPAFDHDRGTRLPAALPLVLAAANDAQLMDLLRKTI